ncbi:MAG TPA: hypothetical protein IAB61_01865 [Candidatus Merdisoma merdipullorum]|nr:hypothetical protein [Candidatus Merdisoma merdipullorum]
MPRMRFTYQKDKKQPILSTISYICGFIYALCLLFALSSLIAGANLITGNRWIDTLIFLAIALIFAILQLIINTLMNKRTTVEQSVSNPLETPAISQSTFATSTEAESLKKKRYCKLCGSELDLNTKKCTGCGKQYFSIRHKAPIILLIMSLIGNIALGYLAFHNHTLYTQTYSKWIDAETNNFNVANDYQSKALFFDLHVVFTTQSGSAYHKYNCYHLEGRDTYYWFKEDAIAEGYTPCQDCY